MLKFKTTLLQGGKTATGIKVPDEIVARLSESKKPAVKVIINGYTYRSTVATMNGAFMIGVSAEVREKAKAFFDTLSYSNKLRFALQVSTAKTPETLKKRLDKCLEYLLAGKKI